MNVQIIVDGTVYEAQLRLADVQLFHRLTMSDPLRSAAERMFGVHEPGREIPIEPATFRADLHVLLNSLVAQKSLWAASYRVGFAADDPRDSRTGIGGLRINSQLYSVVAGLGFCDLQKIDVDAEGVGKVASKLDVRHLELITTDEGAIRIVRKPRKSALVGLVDGMRHLLEREITSVMRRFDP